MTDETFEREMTAGNDAFRSSDFQLAESHYRRCLKMCAEDKHLEGKYRAYSNLSAVFAKRSQWEESREAAESCTKENPSFEKGWSRLGASLRELKRYSEAVAAYRKALQLSPKNEQYLAAVKQLEGMIESGDAAPDQAQLDTFYLKRSLERGTEAMKSGVYQEAVRHFTKALSICRDPSERAVLFANRSAAYFKRKMFEESAEDGRQSVGEDPQYARGYARLGSAELSRSNLKEARAALERALELDPANTIALPLIVEARARYAATEEERRARMDAEERRLQESADAVRMQREQQLQAQKDEEAAKLASLAPELRSFLNRRHTSGYEYCRHCNEYGHTVETCPTKKRQRTEDHRKRV